MSCGAVLANTADNTGRPLDLEHGDGWQEISVNRREAAHHYDAVTSILRGDSIMVVQHLATAEECERLRQGAVAFTADMRFDPVTEAQEVAKLIRRPVEEMCGEPGRALCDQLLLRAMMLMPEALPKSLLGDSFVDSLACGDSPSRFRRGKLLVLDSDALVFSDGAALCPGDLNTAHMYVPRWR